MNPQAFTVQGGPVMQKPRAVGETENNHRHQLSRSVAVDAFLSPLFCVLRENEQTFGVEGCLGVFDRRRDERTNDMRD